MRTERKQKAEIAITFLLLFSKDLTNSDPEVSTPLQQHTGIVLLTCLQRPRLKG